MLEGSDWPCVRCSTAIGRTVRGELIIDGAKANTDGTKLVITCPQCGTPKIWYAKDRAVIQEAVTVLLRMFEKLSRVGEENGIK